MDHPAVGADGGVLVIEVRHLVLLQVRHHLVGVGGLHRLHGLEVVHGRRVVGGLDGGGHALELLEEALGKRPALVVLVPVPAVGQLQALGGGQAQAVNVVDEHQQAGHLHALGDAELLGRLHCVDGVAAGVGQGQDLGLGALGLQQEGREVGRVERVAHRAHHGAAVGLDHRRGVGLERVAEGVVGGEEIPALVAGLHQRGAGHLGQGHRVVGVVHGVGGAVLVGQARGARADHDVGTLLLGRHLGHGDAGPRAGAAHQHGHAVLVDPLAGLGAGHVGLVLVVGGEHLDVAPQHLAAEVLHRHLDHLATGRAVDVGVEAGHVGDETDAHRALGGLGHGAEGSQADGDGCREGLDLEFHASLLPW